MKIRFKKNHEVTKEVNGFFISYEYFHTEDVENGVVTRYSCKHWEEVPRPRWEAIEPVVISHTIQLTYKGRFGTMVHHMSLPDEIRIVKLPSGTIQFDRRVDD